MAAVVDVVDCSVLLEELDAVERSRFDEPLRIVSTALPFSIEDSAQR